MTHTFIGYIAQDINEIKPGINTFTIAYNPPVKDPECIFIKCVMFSDTSNMYKNLILSLYKGSSFCTC